jgi:hypothetical protein
MAESIADSENPIGEVIADDEREAKRGRYGWLSLVVAALFGLFYAYDLWEAVSNLVALPSVYDEVGIGAENVPWWLLWSGVIIPVLVFVLAFVLGRRQNVFAKALIFLLGLAIVAGLSIDVLAAEEVLRPLVLG